MAVFHDFDELVNGLSDEVRDILFTTDNNRNQVIKDYNFQKAYSASKNLQEEQSVIELYIQYMLNNKWKNIKSQEIEPYLDILIRICNELGLSETRNPFLVFIPKYYELNPGKSLTRDNMIDLNNLYANEDLSKEDLTGKSNYRFDHIIFNNKLYDPQNPNVDKMVEYWNWLSKPENLKRMNWQEVRNLNLTPSINEVADELLSLLMIRGGDKKLTSSEPYLDRLYFQGGVKKSMTNTQDTLEELFSAGAIGKKDKVSNLTNKKIASNKSAEDIKNMLIDFAQKNNLDAGDLGEIFKAALDEL